MRKSGLISLLFLSFFLISNKMSGAQAQARQQVVDQGHNTEILPDQQLLLPALLRKTTWQIDGKLCKSLSVSEENYISVLKGGKLHVWNLKGQLIQNSQLENRRIGSYSFVSGRELFIILIDGTMNSFVLGEDGLKNLGYTGNSKTVPYVISPEMYALVSQDGSVAIKFPNVPVCKFEFGHTIDLVASDGNKSFIFGNRNNGTLTVVRQGGVSDKLSLQFLPTTLALGKLGEVYVGTREGKLYIQDAQNKWHFFDTGTTQPVSFIAPFTSILMVANENDNMLKVFSLSNYQLIYKLRFTKNPIKQIAVNRHGTIVCIDQEGIMKILSINPKDSVIFSALSTQQKVSLDALIAYSQKYEVTPEALDQYKEQFSMVPQFFITNVQKMSPFYTPEKKVATPQDRETFTTLGTQNRAQTTFWYKCKRICGNLADKCKHFVQENPNLAATMISLVAYILFFKRDVIKKKSCDFTSWLSRMFKSPVKSSFFLF